MAPVSETRVFPAEVATVVQSVRNAAQRVAWKPTYEHPEQGELGFSNSMSLFSWGENYTVQVVATGPGQTNVTVHGALKMGFADWGRRKKQIAKFFAAMAPPA